MTAGKKFAQQQAQRLGVDPMDIRIAVMRNRADILRASLPMRKVTEALVISERTVKRKADTEETAKD